MNQGCNSEVQDEGTHLRNISEVEVDCVGAEVEGRGALSWVAAWATVATSELETQEEQSPQKYNTLRVNACCRTSQ